MKIRKTHGEYPLNVIVLDETVHFDKNGVAEVDEIIGEVLLGIPGYEEYKEKPKKESKSPENPKGKKDDGKQTQDPPPSDTGDPPKE